jgi:murein DD-endopeptidase MepM/ murein hydrolase activator NlpD
VTSPPERVHVVIEAADGLRLARVAAPRWLVSVITGLVGLGLVAGGALYGDYVALKRQRGVFAAVEDRLAQQQALIDSQRVTLDSQRLLIDGFETRLRQLRTEVDGWRELQGRIWQPFGPDAAPPVPETGVGGTAIRHIEPYPQAHSLQEEMERLASAVLETGQNLRALDQVMIRAGRVLASLPSRWPVRGPVNSEFGVRSSPWSALGEFHSGVDIGAALGTPVLAPASGIVSFAGLQGDYGLTLIIDHGNEIRSLYAHLSRLDVVPDQKIEPGQVVAQTGSTGRSSGPHLHYEIQLQGRAVNPRTFLWH